MSKILFWYLFRDLVRIFLLASGTLAAIMSFGGLLRPLTENGLDLSQVGKMLTYLTPAMMAYSLPAAALFATTVTYGRLAADNELTACRAAGISYAAIGLPAVVLGLMVAIISLVLLCFIVPVFSLKVERVIYSNLAQVFVSKIDRNHQIRIDTGSGKAQTVFAEQARPLPPDPKHPGDELVYLKGPTIASFEPAPSNPALRIPKEFYTVESATVRIHPAGSDPLTDPFEVTLELHRGAKFPRDFASESQGGIDTAIYGPFLPPNPDREDVKFMDLPRLVELAGDASSSQRVMKDISDLVVRDQQHEFLMKLAGEKTAVFNDVDSGEVYRLTTTGPGPMMPGKDELVYSSAVNQRQISLTVTLNGQTTSAQAREARVRVSPDNAAKTMVVTLELTDLTLKTPASGPEPAERASWQRTAEVPMDQYLQELRNTRTMKAYMSDPTLGAPDLLRRDEVVVNNAVRGELHGRASFAVSCLILVLVGWALGMMFKSGNFLTAFAVSFIPALLCITLVVAGQQTADHVPDVITADFLRSNPPLQLGIALIWSGNVIVLGMAVVLIGRMRRR